MEVMMKRKKYIAGCRRCEEIVECRLVTGGHWIPELLLYLLAVPAVLTACAYLGGWGLLVGAIPFAYSHSRTRRRRPVCCQCGGEDVVPAESAAGGRMANPAGLAIPHT